MKHLFSLLLALVSTSLVAQQKQLYDFVVPRDGSFRQALAAADQRPDTTTRFRLFIMSGQYVIPAEGTTTGGDGKEYPDPRTRLASPNVSIIGEDRDATVLTNVTPPATWDNGFGRACPLEGIGRGDVLICEKSTHDTYFQDFSLRSGMEDHTGRNIALNDFGNRTISKNMCLWGYQDTYVSHTSFSRYYFEGGIIRGRCDYICGKGDVLYNGVTFQQCEKAGYLAVPSNPLKYGYVMLNCRIVNETPDVTYYMGRPWGKGTPRAVWINTVIDSNESIVPNEGEHKGWGWADMSGGWPALFTEYNTRLANGEPADMTGRRTIFTDRDGVQHSNTPVLTAEEASIYTLENVMNTASGWNPAEICKEATPVSNLTLRKNVLTWEGSDDALLYAVCRNGKVVDFTTETSYKVRSARRSDVWSIRAANQMGGLGKPVVAE